MFKLFLIIKEFMSYHEPDAVALTECGVDRERYLLWHRRFVRVATTFAILAGAAILVVVIYALATEPQNRPTLGKIGGNDPPGAFKMVFAAIIGPPCGFVFGWIFGATLACLIAPRDFLLGPVGRRWMGFVGTSNIYVAKVVCVIVVAGMLFVGGGLTRALLFGPWIETAKK